MITVGGFNTSLDKALVVDDLRPGAVHRARGVQAWPGGKGLHVALTVAVLGEPVRLVGLIDAAHRREFEERLSARGVEFHGIETPGALRTCLAVRDRDGSRVTEILEPGPEVDAATRDALGARFLDLARGSTLAVLSGSTPPGFDDQAYARLVATLARDDVRVLVDASGGLLRHAVEARPFLVKPNREEAAALSGETVDGPSAAARVARALAERGIAMPVVSLGASGAVAAGEGRVAHAWVSVPGAAYPVGSGDCLLGGMAAALARGQAMGRRCAWAWRAAPPTPSSRRRVGSGARTSTPCASACRAPGSRSGRDLMPPVEGTVHADLQGHTRRVSTVCLATDARHALSASLDRTLRLWEVPSGRCLRVLEGHGSDVNAAALSRDGRWALSGSGEVVTGEMLLRLWDLGTGTAVRDFVGHEAEVSAAAFRGDGALAASGSADATVRLWDVASGGCRHVLKGHGGWVRSVAFTPAGDKVLSGSMDHTVRVWDVEGGGCERVLEGHGDNVYGVTVSPDGRHALSASRDRTLRLWDLVSGATVRVLEGHEDVVRSVCFSGDGRWALTGGEDRTVRVWDVARGGCAWTGKTTGLVLSVALSADRRWALAATYDRHVLLWELAWS